MNLFLTVIALFGNVYEYTPMTVNPDPDWVPGTYLEWRAGQPQFEPLRATEVSGTDGADFLLIFQEGLTDSLDAGVLDQWTADIQSQGLSTQVVEVTYSTPADLKVYLQDRYAQGMEGAVIVGDLPAPWSALEDVTRQTGSVFPSDYFYMDMDGNWEDNWIGYPFMGNPGSDGMYDTFYGSLDAEIYVGRIKVDNLSQLGDPIQILNDYLNRNHQWRFSGDPEPLSALCYVDDDWEYWAAGYKSAMQHLYPNTELVSDPAATNGTDYLENRLPADYVWISPFVHSGPGTHYWEQGPTTTWDELVPALPQAHFYNLFACSNCRFTTVHCMGSVYAFCTSTGLASVGSTKSGAMLSFTQFYEPLGDGASLGEAYRDWWDYIAQGGLSPSERSWHLGMVLLGDPTLMPAMHMLGIEEGRHTPAANITLNSNPCSTVLSITSSLSSGEVGLYDLSGKKVAEGLLEQGACSIQLNDVPSGCYTVRVFSGPSTGAAMVTVIR